METIRLLLFAWVSACGTQAPDGFGDPCVSGACPGEDLACVRGSGVDTAGVCTIECVTTSDCPTVKFSSEQRHCYACRDGFCDTEPGCDK